MSDHGDNEEDLQVFQGKVIVLGDSQTGKSSLVRSLDPVISNERKNRSSADTVDVFSVVEMGPRELKFGGKVLLKICEYSGKDDPIVFEGALIVIITIDLRSSESANRYHHDWHSTNYAHSALTHSKFSFVHPNKFRTELSALSVAGLRCGRST